MEDRAFKIAISLMAAISFSLIVVLLGTVIVDSRPHRSINGNSVGLSVPLQSVSLLGD